MSDSEYYRKAIGFHDYLQARDYFFFTDFFRQRFENRAKKNIARYLAHITD